MLAQKTITRWVLPNFIPRRIMDYAGPGLILPIAIHRTGRNNRVNIWVRKAKIEQRNGITSVPLYLPEPAIDGFMIILIINQMLK